MEELLKIDKQLENAQFLCEIDDQLISKRVDSMEQVFIPTLEKFNAVIANDNMKAAIVKLNGFTSIYKNFLLKYPSLKFELLELQNQCTLNKEKVKRTKSLTSSEVESLALKSSKLESNLSSLVKSVRVVENEYQRKMPEVREICMKMRQ